MNSDEAPPTHTDESAHNTTLPAGFAKFLVARDWVGMILLFLLVVIWPLIVDNLPGEVIKLRDTWLWFGCYIAVAALLINRILLKWSWKEALEMSLVLFSLAGLVEMGTQIYKYVNSI